MIPIIVVTVLVTLALVTQGGVFVLERLHSAAGKRIHVTGAALNVVELGPRDAPGPPVVLLHGASSNLEAMRRPLGDLLAKHRRVILIDRPGHGFSLRDHVMDSTPAIQAKMIDEALEKLDSGPVILVAHSLAGALGARMALDYPNRVAGLVMLAPVTVIAGDADKTVSTSIHSRPFAATVPNAKLIVLPGIGHMIQNAAPDVVVSEIEAMAERFGQGRAAAVAR